MGEAAKTIGEFGEETVSNFLKLIGWGDTPRNISIDCLKNQKHVIDSDYRKTHGIDFFFSYLSPLADSTLKNIHISSKYTTNSYPNSPSTSFHKFVTELSWTIDCFRYSPKKGELNSSIKGYTHTDDEGVLFWLTNNEDSGDDLNQKLRTSNISFDSPMKTLYLIDNRRINFIITSIKYVELNYKDYTINFYYPNTGKNIIPTNSKDYGKILPVEYLNSNVLPIRVEDKEGKSGLVLFSIESFSKGDLARFVGLAKDLTKSWSGFVNICFPDYDRLTHEADVRQIKSDFINSFSTANLTITSYSSSFKLIND